jgi:hypothetical protein
LRHDDGEEEDTIVLLALHAQHVPAGFNAPLSKQCGQGLEQTLRNKTSIRDERPKLLYQLIVQL